MPIANFRDVPRFRSGYQLIGQVVLILLPGTEGVLRDIESPAKGVTHSQAIFLSSCIDLTLSRGMILKSLKKWWMSHVRDDTHSDVDQMNWQHNIDRDILVLLIILKHFLVKETYPHCYSQFAEYY